MRLRSKVWIEEKGEQVFGSGRARMLKAVARAGSLNAAAKDLGMSYRHVWSCIRASEERLGRPLLIKSKGGRSGGGAVLTDYAKDLLRKFEKVEREVRAFVDTRFKNVFKKRSRK